MAAFLLVGTSVFGGVDAEDKCAAAKAKVSAAAVSGQVRCQAKAASKGTPVDVQCLQKAESKLRRAFARADSKGACEGDADTALAAVGACTTAFGGAVSGDGRCAAKKLKATGRRTRDEAACARKGAAKGPEAAAACLAAADAKFQAAIGRADRQGTCTATAAELAALRPVPERQTQFHHRVRTPAQCRVPHRRRDRVRSGDDARDP